MLLMAYFQWRTVNGLAEISAALPSVRALGPGSSVAALGLGGEQLVSNGQAEQSNMRLLGAMERLEKRIYELEHTSGAKPETGPRSNGVNGGAAPAQTPAHLVSEVPAEAEPDPVAALLARGEAMLNADKPEEALACFDEALALAPGHTEGLVKKGTALERLQKLNEAVECYDQAIAVDDSMTIAYLHKGGLFNRMERFNEALECYEKALRTQEKRQS
jgi:tetratricopeptide (TPR) repeat protein